VEAILSSFPVETMKLFSVYITGPTSRIFCNNGARTVRDEFFFSFLFWIVLQITLVSTKSNRRATLVLVQMEALPAITRKYSVSPYTLTCSQNAVGIVSGHRAEHEEYKKRIQDQTILSLVSNEFAAVYKEY